MDAAEALAQIDAVLAAKADPDGARHRALARTTLDKVDWRVGQAPPDNSLDARWRRAVAADPAAVLGALTVEHDPPAARVFGNGHEYELTLPDGAGRLVVKFLPGQPS